MRPSAPGLRLLLVLRPDPPAEALDLVLAGLDGQPDQLDVGEGPQVREAEGLVGARRVDEVGADREVEDARTGCGSGGVSGAPGEKTPLP
jgi:hypothetical protein